jgi:RNA polymerase sigma factor for flagellar operon FliA
VSAMFSIAVDAATPDKLINDHMGLVRKIAWQVYSRVSTAIEKDDLVQIGLLALIEAGRTFEQRGEATFATYAAVRVKGAMIDELRRQATMSRGAMRQGKAIAEAERQLTRELGRSPERGEIAARLGLDLTAYGDALASAQGHRQESLDDVYSDHLSVFASEEPSAHEALADKSMREVLVRELKQLPEREAMVMQLYFVEELNLEEIGAVLGVGAARVCQIKKAAMDRLRERLKQWRA